MMPTHTYILTIRTLPRTLPRMPVTTPLNTFTDVIKYHYELIGKMDEKPEKFKNEKLPYSKEHCDWKIAQIDKQIENNSSLIKLLRDNLIDRKVKGQIRIAQSKVKELKEEYWSLRYSKDPWRNGGIW